MSVINWILKRPVCYRLNNRLFRAEEGFRQVISLTGYRRGLRFLDIGCGTGELAKFIDPADYVGIDLSEEYIADARKHYGGQFLALSADRVGELDDSFDVAVEVGVFHHLSDEQVRATLDGLTRVIKPDGKVVIHEAVWPTRWWDVPGYVIRRLDRGKYVRTVKQWHEVLQDPWQLVDPRVTRRGILERFECCLKLPAPRPQTSGNGQARESSEVP
jgi:cyclopropane fatty-acyl-phospholipid synthase-like methyltransferase